MDDQTPADDDTIRGETDGILDFVSEVGDQLRSRRAFMGDAAKVGVGAAALSAVGAGSAVANDDSESGPSDLDILNYALTLEHLEYAFYEEFLANHTESEVENSAVAQYFARPTLRYSTYQQIEDVRDHEGAHVEALTETIEKLGGTPVEPAEYEFPYDTMEEFVAIADRLEAVGVSAYAGAAPMIDDEDVLKAALSIHSVEAEHQTYFQLLHLQRPAPDAFNTARSMDQVLPIAKQFIVGAGGGGDDGGDGGDGGESGQTVTVGLSGEQEVPPVDTDASGDATLTLTRDPPELEYELTVSNIENVTAAHIHIGNEGENGPIVAPLFSDESGVSEDGVLATGTITEDDLVGPLEGKSFSELQSMVEEGAYVNVHTKEHPKGEIRGQIQV
ncbi:ferritin-like domain-containing protein [Halococcus agarilyticus]|uniref:ferritin-like domain-containing protein n=1 Tax=Halococcus agarilyticus TaxID=1232219 RepID=UPI0006782A34|nr:ferritin-like domain-containing protein [Halococcus agarilyticus]